MTVSTQMPVFLTISRWINEIPQKGNVVWFSEKFNCVGFTGDGGT